jgi:hypothetical protein
MVVHQGFGAPENYGPKGADHRRDAAAVHTQRQKARFRKEDRRAEHRALHARRGSTFPNNSGELR